MRKKIAAGNWKMNLDAEAAQTLASELRSIYESEVNNGIDVVLAPPFVHIHSVQHLVGSHPNFHVAGQNLHQAEKGAYTGEVAGSMLRSVGCTHVIIGHSERRQYFGEDDALLTEKLNRALASDLVPIFCFGESLEDREAGNTFAVVKGQLENAAFGLSAEDFSKLVLAYEPVWAIGTGKTATPEQAQEVHAYLRGLVAAKYGDEIADNTTILYGGSVKPANANALFAQPDIDGGLVGGASLKSRDFSEIIRALGA